MKAKERIKKFIIKNKKELFQIGIMAAVVIVPMITGTSVEAAQSGAGTNMPWSTGINALQKELTGPLPKIGATVAVAITGLMMSFGEMSGMTRKALQVVMGLGIAIGATTFVMTLSGDSTVSGCIF